MKRSSARGGGAFSASSTALLVRSWASSGTRLLQGFRGQGIHRQDVVPVGPDPVKPEGGCFFGDALSRGLEPNRRGDGILVVEADEHVRCPKNSGKVQRFVEIHFRGRAVTEIGDNGRPFLSVY